MGYEAGEELIDEPLDLLGRNGGVRSLQRTGELLSAGVGRLVDLRLAHSQRVLGIVETRGREAFVLLVLALLARDLEEE